MLYVCVRDVMDFVFSFVLCCVELYVLVYVKCKCFVMQMLYVCVLYVSCFSSQCCVLHDLQFVNAGRGCKRRPYGRGMFKSCLMTALRVAMSVSNCLPNPVAVSAFIICRGLCACTQMM